ncbi:hypothetical protein O181_017619 [Austropuccinia psidii MF-1]|uniref:Uncharacterized protein n=1 Tax=Austropuccinia psidii MF-1 TaxID=1389203 RepID=A0A9Q3C627_9BASI|nr:hypothetical protein [Austropuccinia psidii MF-1]
MIPSEIMRFVDVNQIKRIHFGRVAIFSSTGLVIPLVKFRPFTTMSEIEVNRWDELSQFVFHKRNFTDLIATNGHSLRDLCLQLGGTNSAQRTNNLVFMEVLGKLKMQKMNGRTKVQILAWPVQDPNAVHANPYTCTGYQQFKQLLMGGSLATIQKLLTPGKPPNNSNTSLSQCRLPMVHTQNLGLLQVPDNSNNSLLWCRLLTLHTQILMLVKVPNNSENYLFWLRLFTLHMQILALLQVPNNSDNS